MNRTLYQELWRTLDGFKPMVFMAGPRQVGKTTLAKQIRELALHYVRTKDGEEVDFLLARGRDPILLVETTSGDTNASPALRKLQRLLDLPAIQLVNRPGVYKRLTESGLPLVIASAEAWLPLLP